MLKPRGSVTASSLSPRSAELPGKKQPAAAANAHAVVITHLRPARTRARSCARTGPFYPARRREAAGPSLDMEPGRGGILPRDEGSCPSTGQSLFLHIRGGDMR